MDINSITSESLFSSETFRSLDPKQKTEAIEKIASKMSPDAGAFLLESSAGLMEMDRQAKGQGRTKLDDRIQGTLREVLPADFNDLGKEQQIEAISKARPLVEDKASLVDPVNKNDTAYFADQALNSITRDILKDDVTEFGDKRNRFVGGLIQSFASQFGEQGVNQFLAENLPTNPDYDQTTASKLTQATGDFVGQIGQFIGITALATTGVGAPAAAGIATTVAFANNASRKFQENYNLARGEMGLTEDQALEAGIAGMPGAVIDTLGDTLLLRGIKLGTVSKAFKSMTAAEKAAEIVAKGGSVLKDPTALRAIGKNVATGFLKEGVSESLGDAATAWGGYATSNHEGFKPSAESLWESFWIGGVLGGGFSGAFQTKGDLRNQRALKELGKINKDDFIALAEEQQTKIAELMDSENYDGALKLINEFQKKTAPQDQQAQPDAQTGQEDQQQGETIDPNDIVDMGNGDIINLKDEKKKEESGFHDLEDDLLAVVNQLEPVGENPAIRSAHDRLMAAKPAARQAVRTYLSMNPDLNALEQGLDTLISIKQPTKANASQEGNIQQDNQQQPSQTQEGGLPTQTGVSDSANQGQTQTQEVNGQTTTQEEVPANATPEGTQSETGKKAVSGAPEAAAAVTPERKARTRKKVQEQVDEVIQPKQKAKKGSSKKAPKITAEDLSQDEIQDVVADVQDLSQEAESIPQSADIGQMKDATKARIASMERLAKYKSFISQSFQQNAMPKIKSLADVLNKRVDQATTVDQLNQINASLDDKATGEKIITRKDIDEILTNFRARLNMETTTPDQAQAIQGAIYEVSSAEMNPMLFQGGANLANQKQDLVMLEGLSIGQLKSAKAVVQALRELGIDQQASNIDKELALDIQEAALKGSMSREINQKLNDAIPSRAIWQNKLNALIGFGNATKANLQLQYDIIGLNWLRTGGSLQAYWARMPDIKVVDREYYVSVDPKSFGGNQDLPFGTFAPDGVAAKFFVADSSRNGYPLHDSASSDVNNNAPFRVAFSPVAGQILLTRGLYDTTTMAHELDHNLIVTGTAERIVGPELWSEVEKELGMEGQPIWTVGAHEKWVAAREAWMRGREVSNTFQRVFAAMKKIYNRLFADGALDPYRNPVLEKAFAKIYDLNIEGRDLRNKVGRDYGYMASKLVGYVPLNKMAMAQSIMESASMQPDLDQAIAQLTKDATSIVGDRPAFTRYEADAMKATLREIYTQNKVEKEAPVIPDNEYYGVGAKVKSLIDSGIITQQEAARMLYNAGVITEGEVSNYEEYLNSISRASSQNDDSSYYGQDEIPTGNTGGTVNLGTVTQSEQEAATDASVSSEQLRSEIIKRIRSSNPLMPSIDTYFAEMQSRASNGDLKNNSISNESRMPADEKAATVDEVKDKYNSGEIDGIEMVDELDNLGVISESESDAAKGAAVLADSIDFIYDDSIPSGETQDTPEDLAPLISPEVEVESPNFVDFVSSITGINESNEGIDQSKAESFIASEAMMILSDSAKSTYAAFVGASKWTIQTSKRFAKDFARFVSGIKFSESIAKIFSAFKRSVRAMAIAGISTIPFTQTASNVESTINMDSEQLTAFAESSEFALDGHEAIIIQYAGDLYDKIRNEKTPQGTVDLINSLIQGEYSSNVDISNFVNGYTDLEQVVQSYEELDKDKVVESNFVLKSGKAFGFKAGDGAALGRQMISDLKSKQKEWSSALNRIAGIVSKITGHDVSGANLEFYGDDFIVRMAKDSNKKGLSKGMHGAFVDLSTEVVRIHPMTLLGLVSDDVAIRAKSASTIANELTHVAQLKKAKESGVDATKADITAIEGKKIELPSFVNNIYRITIATLYSGTKHPKMEKESFDVSWVASKAFVGTTGRIITDKQIEDSMSLFVNYSLRKREWLNWSIARNKNRNRFTNEFAKDAYESSVLYQRASSQGQLFQNTSRSTSPEVQQQVSRFNELTKDLYPARLTYIASFEADEWKKENPEKHQEIIDMRKGILKNAGFYQENGELVPFYHGTPSDFFDTFNTNRSGYNFGAGAYFSANEKFATGYTGAKYTNDGSMPDGSTLFKVYLKLQNPYKTNTKSGFSDPAYKLEKDDNQKFVELQKRAAKRILGDESRYEESTYVEVMNEMVRDMGHDSIIYNFYGEDMEEVIVFEPEQIKAEDPISRGFKITPDQWASQINPSILFQRANQSQDETVRISIGFAAALLHDAANDMRSLRDAALAAGVSGAEVAKMDFGKDYKQIQKIYNRLVSSINREAGSYNPTSKQAVKDASKIIEMYRDVYKAADPDKRKELSRVAGENYDHVSATGIEDDSMARENNIRRSKNMSEDEAQRVEYQDAIKYINRLFGSATGRKSLAARFRSHNSPQFMEAYRKLELLFSRGNDNVMGAFNDMNKDLFMSFHDNIKAYMGQNYEQTPAFIENWMDNLNQVEEEVFEFYIRQISAYKAPYMLAYGIDPEIDSIIDSINREPQESAMDYYERLDKFIKRIEAIMFMGGTDSDNPSESTKERRKEELQKKRLAIAERHKKALDEKFENFDEYLAYYESKHGGKLKENFRSVLQAAFKFIKETNPSSMDDVDLRNFNTIALTMLVGGNHTALLIPLKNAWRVDKIASWKRLVELMRTRVGESPLVRPIFRSAARSTILQRRFNDFDKKFQANVENFSVWLDRLSQYGPVRNWFEREFFSTFTTAAFTEAENAKKGDSQWFQSTIEDYNKSGTDNTVDANPYLWVYSLLSQYNLGTDPNKTFANMVKKAQTSINKMKASMPSQMARNEADRNQVALDYMLEGIDTNSDTAYDDFMRKASEGRLGNGDLNKTKQRLELLQNISDYFSRDKANQVFVTEVIRGNPFTTVANYLPLKTVNVDGTPDRWDWTNMEPDVEHDPSAKNVNVNSQSERELSIGVDRAYVMDFFNMVERKLAKNAIDREVTLPVSILHDMFKGRRVEENGITELRPADPSMRAIFGDSQEAMQQIKTIKEKITHQMVQVYGMTEPADSFVSSAKKAIGFVQGTMLSGLGQFFQQSSAALVDYSLREEGNISYMIDAIRYYTRNYQVVRQWLLENNKDIYERGNTQGILEFERQINNAGSELSKVMKTMQGIDDIRRFMTLSLRYGDKIGAELIFLAEHRKQLEQSNKITRNAEYDIRDYSDPAITTAANNNLMRYIGPSSAAGRSYWMSDHKNTYFALRVLTGAFQSSAHNMSSQIISAARNIKNLQSDNSAEGKAERKAEYRKIGSIMAQQATFTTVRFLFSGMVTYAMVGAIRSMFDDEDGAIEELQLELERARKRAYPSPADKARAIAMAERKLADAKTIRRAVINMKQQTSGDAWWKSMARDQLMNLHIVNSVGDGLVTKGILMVPNMMQEASQKEAQDLTIAALKKDRSRAIKMGDRRKAAQISESIADAQAVEFIPYFYEKKDKSGFSGMIGGVLDPIMGAGIEASEDLTRDDRDFLTTRAFIPDMITYMAAAGVGQADVNRIARQFQRLDDQLSKNRQKAEEKAGTEAEKLTNKPRRKYL